MRLSLALSASALVLLACADARSVAPSPLSDLEVAADTTEPGLSSADTAAVRAWCLGLLEDVTASRTAGRERAALEALGRFHHRRAETPGAVTFPVSLSAQDDAGNRVPFSSGWHARATTFRMTACDTTVQLRPLEVANVEGVMQE